MTTPAHRRRRRWPVVVVGLVVLVLTGLLVLRERVEHPMTMAASTAPVALAPTPDEQPPPARPSRPPRLVTGLAAASVAAAQEAAEDGTELAVAVLDRATGETAEGERAREPYYTASLSKVVVAVDVLDRRRLDGLTVTDTDLALFRRALGPSDDSAMNALWSRFDGSGAAGRVSMRLGLVGTSDPRDPSQWGEMSVPAVDTVRIWQHILDEIPPADRDLLIGDLHAAPARAADGFDQAFGLLSPDVDGTEGPGAVAKQGWMCCFSSIYYLHSAGAVGPGRRFVVALLDRVPRSGGWEAARQELDRVAAAAVQPLL